MLKYGGNMKVGNSIHSDLMDVKRKGKEKPTAKTLTVH